MADMAILVDTTKCTGCRGCQVACKQWNNLPWEKKAKRTFFGGPGYQNPRTTSERTYTVVKFGRVTGGNDLDADGNWNFLKFQCMHCNNAPCMIMCPLSAILRSPEGFTYVDTSVCNPSVCDTGLGPVCVSACPFRAAKVGALPGAPKKAAKCRGCYDRAGYFEPAVPPTPGGTVPLVPACVKSCPTTALSYDTRVNVVAAAQARVADAAVQAKYPNVNAYNIAGLYGGGHVIYVLTQPPAFYKLPDVGA